MTRGPDHASVTDERLFETLAQIDGNRKNLHRLEHLVLSLLRDRGFTWDGIGEQMGLTRQGVQARYKAAARDSV